MRIVDILNIGHYAIDVEFSVDSTAIFLVFACLILAFAPEEWKTAGVTLVLVLYPWRIRKTIGKGGKDEFEG